MLKTGGDTILALKQLTPVGLIKMHFVNRCSTRKPVVPQLKNYRVIGQGPCQKGMFEGDLDEGELEIGQVAALIREIKPAADIVTEIWQNAAGLMHQPID